MTIHILSHLLASGSERRLLLLGSGSNWLFGSGCNWQLYICGSWCNWWMYVCGSNSRLYMRRGFNINCWRKFVWSKWLRLYSILLYLVFNVFLERTGPDHLAIVLVGPHIIATWQATALPLARGRSLLFQLLKGAKPPVIVTSPSPTFTGRF